MEINPMTHTDKPAEYVDWQKALSDDFDIDGYSMPNAAAQDVHAKFRKAKADGMREAADFIDINTTLNHTAARLRDLAEEIEKGQS